MTERRKKRSHWTVWLVYAVIVAALVSTTTLSRYITTVSGSGTATIATVDMKGHYTGQDVENIDVSGMTPGTTKTTTFTVVNFNGANISQVALSYTIEINTTGNLPLTYTLQCTNTGGSGTGIYITPATVLTPGSPSTVGTLPHSTQTTHTYTLTVTWPSGENDPKYADEVDAVELIVRSEQIIPQ